MVKKSLETAYKDTTNAIVQDNGRILKESLLVGPRGVVKMQSVWDGAKLINVQIFGGRN